MHAEASDNQEDNMPHVRELRPILSVPDYRPQRSFLTYNAASFEHEATLPFGERWWVRRIWSLHFIISVVIIYFGILHNKTSKYVPIGLEKLSDDHCERAFLNVLAVSDRIENAIVCCTDNSSIASPCPSESNFLPFANRLARWPDAWLFPLFPLLFRLLYTAFRGLENTYYSDKHNSAIISSFVSMTALRRLGYYVILLNFRGWVLYVGLNAIEDRIVQPVDNETCWYHEWLRVDQSRCFGRVFDFSDHIVLYYAQILPVALFEFLHTLEYPFWAYSRSMFKSTDHVAIVDRLCPILMCFGICYLYFITCLGVYKTSVYFHTGFEVVVGFLVSSIVQIPLCLIQCSDQMETMRDFLFATSHVKYKGLT